MRFPRLAALLAIPVQVLLGQQSGPKPISGPLTLDDAIAIARQNNPAFRESENSLRTADAQVRSTYGALLPTASASASAGYQQGGIQNIQGIQLQGPDSYNSSYSLGLGYNISAGALLYAPRAVKANRDATVATIRGSGESLRAQITQLYIQALESDAQAALQDTLVQGAQAQLDLAKAKLTVGAGIILDVRNAEVVLGTQHVQALQAHTTAQVAKLQLSQAMGVPPSTDVQLTTSFPVSRPAFSLDSLLTLARRINPTLNAARATQFASDMNVKLQKMSYTPTLSLSTGFGAQAFQYADPNYLVNQTQLGYANALASCTSQDSLRAGAGLSPINCSPYVFTPAQADAIRASRSSMPWGAFAKRPLGLSAFLQVPLFNGFQREQNVEQARVTSDNAQFEVRNQDLQMTTNVTQAYLTLVTDAQAVQLQVQNAATAREAMSFAEERYRVGAATFLDVITAHGTFEQAEIARVSSIYDYHKAFAALEGAVGRPLR